MKRFKVREGRGAVAASLIAPILLATISVFFLATSDGAREVRDSKAVAGRRVHCGHAPASINVSIGMSVAEASKHSPAFEHIKDPLAKWAPAAYLYEPTGVKVGGEIPISIDCPYLVIITPQDGRVQSVDIELRPVHSLDAGMALLGQWYKRLGAMGLAPPPPQLAGVVSSFEMARADFAEPVLAGGLFGDTVGAWRRGSEVISLSMEKREVGAVGHPKLIYVVELSVSDVSVWLGR